MLVVMDVISSMMMLQMGQMVLMPIVFFDRVALSFFGSCHSQNSGQKEKRQDDSAFHNDRILNVKQ
jgi:hypothetical protein